MNVKATFSLMQNIKTVGTYAKRNWMISQAHQISDVIARFGVIS